MVGETFPVASQIQFMTIAVNILLYMGMAQITKYVSCQLQPEKTKVGVY